MLLLYLCAIAIAIAFLLSCPPSIRSELPEPYAYQTANLSTLWIKGENSNILENNTHTFPDGSRMRPIFDRVILTKEDNLYPLGYACGLYCKGTNCDSFLFAISIFTIDDESLFIAQQVVWSANRNNPVGENASMELTNGGDLLLKDADGLPALRERRLPLETDRNGKFGPIGCK